MTKNTQPKEKIASPDAAASRRPEAPEDGIGSRLRAARERRGLSQVAVSTRSKSVDIQGKGVHRTVMVGYEAGQSRPGAREIRILCEVLAVTPNWLILGDEVALAGGQASMEAVRHNGLAEAIGLGMAISILKPHERSAFQSLVLSMAGRELGDLRLSGLLFMATRVARPILKELEECFNLEGGDSDSVDVLLDALVRQYGQGVDTNFGNSFIFGEDGEGVIGGEFLYKQP